ncbi:MAG: DNA-directed RNA polymerase subunit delta [Erysipelotrichaceae bacterium]|nr:DNA-directed RNA polymerase subunit delta [Erysipelotrichaceae bacterium]
MERRSTLDIAFQIIEEANQPFPFYELWEKVVEVQQFSEKESAEVISRFYTNLTLDGRFVNLGDNTWDLRKNNTYDKVHIDINEVYTADDQDQDDDIEELTAQMEEAKETGMFENPEEFDDEEI